MGLKSTTICRIFLTEISMLKLIPLPTSNTLPSRHPLVPSIPKISFWTLKKHQNNLNASRNPNIEQKLSVSEIESHIKAYISTGDWCELCDYLMNPEFESLIEKDEDFQKLINSVLHNMFKTSGFTDSSQKD